MNDEDDDRMPFAWGDMGAITLMAGVGLFSLWLIGDMLLGGHPLGLLFGAGQQQTVSTPPPTAEEIRSTPMTLVPGEVRIIMTPAKLKKPPPKPKN